MRGLDDMINPGLKVLNSLKNSASVMRSVHWIARGLFRQQGFHWEVRRKGELCLGIWKKTIRPRDQHRSYPKRFVLMPGFGDTPLSWHFVITLLQPLLNKHFDEIVLFDFPGFGGFLSREKSFPSMDLMISTVNDALDSLKPHTLFGHSLGGWLAGLYGAHCGSGERPVSNRLNYAGPHTLILANPSGVYPDETTKNEIISIFEHCRKKGFSMLRPHLFAKEPAWFPLIVPDFQKFIQREDIHQFMESVREDHVIEKIAHQIQSKVWLIWGEKDTLVPSACSEAWINSLNADRREHHQVVYLRESGHSPHLEQPAITAAILGQIIAQRTPHRLGSRWWKLRTVR